MQSTTSAELSEFGSSEECFTVAAPISPQDVEQLQTLGYLIVLENGSLSACRQVTH